MVGYINLLTGEIYKLIKVENAEKFCIEENKWLKLCGIPAIVEVLK